MNSRQSSARTGATITLFTTLVAGIFAIGAGVHADALPVTDHLSRRLDAADNTTLSSDPDSIVTPLTHDPIASRSDKISNYQFLQLETGFRPMRDGLLRFDGTGNVMSSNNPIIDKTLPQTIFIVARQNPGSNQVLISNTTHGSGYRIGFSRRDDHNYLEFFDNPTTIYDTPMPVSGELAVITLVSHATDTQDGAMQFYVDGEATTTDTDLQLSSDAEHGMFLGGLVDGSQLLDGGIGEVIAYQTALTPEQRSSVEQYLADKRGIVTTPIHNLSVTKHTDHPQVTVGDERTYTLDYHNTLGTSVGTTISDSLPAGMSFVSYTGTDTRDFSTQQDDSGNTLLSRSGATLASGDQGQVTVTAHVDSAPHNTPLTALSGLQLWLDTRNSSSMQHQSDTATPGDTVTHRTDGSQAGHDRTALTDDTLPLLGTGRYLRPALFFADTAHISLLSSLASSVTRVMYSQQQGLLYDRDLTPTVDISEMAVFNHTLSDREKNYLSLYFDNKRKRGINKTLLLPASISARNDDTDESDNTTTLPLTVVSTRSGSDLTLEGFVDDSNAVSGENITLHRNYQNLGPGFASDAHLTLILPDGLTGQTDFPIGDIAPGSSGSISTTATLLVCNPEVSRGVTGTITPVDTDADPDDNVSVASGMSNQKFDLPLSISWPSETYFNHEEQLTLTLTGSTHTAYNGHVGLTLPTGLVYETGDFVLDSWDNLVVSGVTIPAQQVQTFHATVRVFAADQTGVIITGSFVHELSTTPVLATGSITILPSNDLATTITIDKPIIVSHDTVTFTLTYANLTGSTTNATVTASLPDGLSETGHTWNLTGIEPGTSGSLVLTATVLPGYAIGTGVFEAHIEGTGKDFSPDNNDVSGVLTRATASDLSILRTGTTTPLLPLTWTSHTRTITNLWPDDNSWALLTVTLPQGFVSRAASVDVLNSGATTSGSFYRFALTGLAAGESTSLTITGYLRNGYISNTLFPRSAVVTSPVYDMSLDNNAVTGAIQLAPYSDLSVTQQSSPAISKKNDFVTYTIFYHNSSVNTGKHVILSSAFSTGISYISSTPSYNTFTNGGSWWDLGDIAPGSSGSIFVLAYIEGDAPDGEAHHTISITGDDVDLTPTNNSYSSSVFLDTQAPMGLASYDLVPLKSSDRPVTANLNQLSEPVTVTNNNGLQTYLFTTNGSFTYEISDGVGLTGTVQATVDRIDTTAPVVTGSYSPDRGTGTDDDSDRTRTQGPVFVTLTGDTPFEVPAYASNGQLYGYGTHEVALGGSAWGVVNHFPFISLDGQTMIQFETGTNLLDAEKGFVISTRFRTSTLWATQILFSNASPTGTNPYRGITAYITPSNKIRIALTDRVGKEIQLEAPQPLLSGHRYSLQWTSDGSETVAGNTLALNGDIQDTTTVLNTLTSSGDVTTSTPLTFGAWANGTSEFQGDLADITLTTLSGNLLWKRGSCGGTDTLVCDASGKQNNPTIIHRDPETTGSVRGFETGSASLSFDGDKRFVSINNSNLPANQHPRSISFWVNLQSLGTENLLGYGTVGTGQLRDVISRNGTIGINIGGDELDLDKPLTVGQRYHIEFSYDGITLRGYRNGILVASKEVHLITVSDGRMLIGKGRNTSYNNQNLGFALSDVELSASALDPIGAPHLVTNVVGQWLVNDTDGDITLNQQDFALVHTIPYYHNTTENLVAIDLAGNQTTRPVAIDRLDTSVTPLHLDINYNSPTRGFTTVTITGEDVGYTSNTLTSFADDHYMIDSFSGTSVPDMQFTVGSGIYSMQKVMVFSGDRTGTIIYHDRANNQWYLPLRINSTRAPEEYDITIQRDPLVLEPSYLSGVLTIDTLGSTGITNTTVTGIVFGTSSTATIDLPPLGYGVLYQMQMDLNDNLTVSTTGIFTPDGYDFSFGGTGGISGAKRFVSGYSLVVGDLNGDNRIDQADLQLLNLQYKNPLSGMIGLAGTTYLSSYDQAILLFNASKHIPQSVSIESGNDTSDSSGSIDSGTSQNPLLSAPIFDR